jgi:hypothetical protein
MVFDTAEKELISEIKVFKNIVLSFSVGMYASIWDFVPRSFGLSLIMHTGILYNSPYTDAKEIPPIPIPATHVAFLSMILCIS